MKLYISKLNSVYCPVAYVTKFLQEARLDPVKDGESFLIPRLAKTKQGHCVVKNKGISYSTMRELFKNTLKGVVENVDRFGLHSLRSGGASTAAANRVSDRMISKQGGWKSEKVRNRYNMDTLRNRLKVSKIFRYLDLQPFS